MSGKARGEECEVVMRERQGRLGWAGGLRGQGGLGFLPLALSFPLLLLTDVLPALSFPYPRKLLAFLGFPALILSGLSFP